VCHASQLALCHALNHFAFGLFVFDLCQETKMSEQISCSEGLILYVQGNPGDIFIQPTSMVYASTRDIFHSMSYSPKPLVKIVGLIATAIIHYYATTPPTPPPSKEQKVCSGSAKIFEIVLPWLRYATVVSLSPASSLL
jgi:hypothetical protein